MRHFLLKSLISNIVEYKKFRLEEALLFFFPRAISLASFFVPLKCFNLFRVDTSFMGPSINAPLSWQVDGIVGQTNTLPTLLSV